MSDREDVPAGQAIERSSRGGGERSSGASRRLVRAAPSGLSGVGASASPAADVDWEKLWLSTQRAKWQSLALLPAGDMPPDFTLKIAVALARTGSMHLGVPVRVAEATQVPLAHLVQFMSEIRGVLDAGDLVLLALGPIARSSTTVPLAQSSDRALLCVPLGVSKLSHAKQTISDVGAERFLGSAIFKV